MDKLTQRTLTKIVCMLPFQCHISKSQYRVPVFYGDLNVSKQHMGKILIPFIR